MNNFSINTFYNYSAYIFKEVLLPLSAKQKKIAIIATIATATFSCLSIGYIIFSHYYKNKFFSVNKDTPLFLKEDDFDKAEAVSQEILIFEPKKSGDLCASGHLLRQQGKLEEAEEKYLEALKIEPKCLNSMAGLAEILRLKGHPAEAAVRFQEILAQNPKHKFALRCCGDAFRDAHAYIVACDMYLEVLFIGFRWLCQNPSIDAQYYRSRKNRTEN
jgi:tetratricopeptide (TPR) repeat protein